MFLFKHIFCIPGTPVLLWLSNALVKEPPALVGRGGRQKGEGPLPPWNWAARNHSVPTSPLELGFTALINLYPGRVERGAGSKPVGRRRLPRSSPRWPYTRPSSCDSNVSTYIFSEIRSDSQAFGNMSSRNYFMNHQRGRGRLCWPAPETTNRAGSTVSH